MKILYVGNLQAIHFPRWVDAALASGIDVRVASFYEGPSAAPLTILCRGGLGKLGYLLAPVQLRREARRFQPDIVHAHYATSYGSLCAFAGLHPLVVTVWGSDLFEVPGTTPAHWWLARRAFRAADLVTVVADHMKPRAIELGADPARLETVVFGLDFREFHPPAARPPNTRFRIVCTRNFTSTVYRVNNIIRALGILKREGRALECDLIGSGPLRRALERQCRQVGIAEDVRFPGSLPPARLVDTLQRADVFVTPAASDGNSVSLTEAMACGAFPIASDIPANRQWLTHGVNGLLYPTDDVDALVAALKTAMDSPALREQARAPNWEIVQRRASWETEAKRMFALYDRLLARVRAV